MWEIDNSFQFISFIVSCIFGIVYCLGYDVIRAFRKAFSSNDGIVFLQDIIYFFIISVVTFMLMCALSNGEIRAYVIMGILLGFLLCFFTASKINLKLLTYIFQKNVILSDKIVSLINAFLDTICSFFGKVRQKIKKMLNNAKKILKNHLKKTG